MNSREFQTSADILPRRRSDRHFVFGLTVCLSARPSFLRSLVLTFPLQLLPTDLRNAFRHSAAARASITPHEGLLRDTNILFYCRRLGCSGGGEPFPIAFRVARYCRRTGKMERPRARPVSVIITVGFFETLCSRRSLAFFISYNRSRTLQRHRDGAEDNARRITR